MSVENRNCGCGSTTQNIIEVIDNNSCGCGCAMNNNVTDCNCFNQTREEMANRIKSLDFAIIELGLFLDIHPDNARALCLHRKYTNEVRELKDKYQKVYGPLTIHFPCNKWRWVEEPWPWERGNF